MDFTSKMESVLILISSVLCTILLFKFLYKLRITLPWRVNCWFCNRYLWVKFIDRNSWSCVNCEQYNGFTKDGDYNKVLCPANEMTKTPKVFNRSSPKNGLCKMCNINQQLKVTQLANFVPINERNFEEEIEGYKLQLEKAYKLCSPCKNVVLNKLHKEKETLLGYKLLQARTPDKNTYKQQNHQILKKVINNTSTLIACILFILVATELYQNIQKNASLSSTIRNIKEILVSLLKRVLTIVKVKTLMTFPSLEVYLDSVHNISSDNFDWIPKKYKLNLNAIDNYNILTQKALGGFVCLIQIVGHVWSVNKQNYSIIIDLLWTIFVISSIAHNYVGVDPVVNSISKMFNILAVLIVYIMMSKKASSAKVSETPKRMKNLRAGAAKSHISDVDDTFVMETDDDVSLSKFGLHNFTDSSNETVHQHNSLFNGRSFTPRCEGIWSKPVINPTFCVNSIPPKSPSSVSETVFLKPTFSKFQNLTKDDSDSDLDESISSLCISSPKKSKKSSNSVFTLRKFTATPNFIAPTPLNRARPLISPSKLGHSTSWVAGGYWGADGDRPLFSVNGSRSSSQSSGFESQASSMNQRNVFSQPPSREESIFGDRDQAMLVDPFQNCNVSSCGSQVPQSFVHVNSPVYPQMQYNSHVHIPQPRLAQQNVMFAQQYAQTNLFKAPGGPGLLKLPQVNSFSSR